MPEGNQPVRKLSNDEHKRLAEQWKPGLPCPFCGAEPTVQHPSKHRKYHTTQNFACKRHWVTLSDGAFGVKPPPIMEPPRVEPVEEITADSFEFDSEQLSIIDAETSARLIVNAPPGTGKTAVACGRIAALLHRGVPPHQIWLVSFTRTAIQELRNRIEALAVNEASAYGVRVTTLDSRAWHLIQGFTGKGSDVFSAGGYSGTISDAIKLLKSDDDQIADFFGELSHVIVDEAQDLVGDRSVFIEEVIRRTPDRCGFTVLTDDAQAIYAFAEEDDTPADRSGTLPQRLRRDFPRMFVERELKKVYRTKSVRLNSLFIDARAELLHAISAATGTSQTVIGERIAQYGDGVAESVRQRAPTVKTLVLYRRRFEVIEASTWLASSGIKHRIRMSGVPVCLHPWIAIAFSKPAPQRLTRALFDARWTEVESALGTETPNADEAWKNLKRTAGDGAIVRMDQLRDVLSRPRPPIEFVTPELGLAGPVISTIHASKGREAAFVNLMLPNRGNSDNSDDEARVLFVGATRAKQLLLIGQGSSTRCSRTEQSRIYRRLPARGGQRLRAQVQLGLDGDVDRMSPVSRMGYPDEADVEGAQQWLRENASGTQQVRLYKGNSEDWRYVARIGEAVDGMTIGKMNTSFGYGLLDVAKSSWGSARYSTPPWIGPITMLSACSVAVPVDHSDVSNIHSRWAESGFWLAPVLVGMPMIPFRKPFR
jgi:hypothetical protein